MLRKENQRRPSLHQPSLRAALGAPHRTKWGLIAGAIAALALGASAGCSSENKGSSGSGGTGAGSGGSTSSSTSGAGGESTTTTGGGGSGGAPVECNPTKNPGPATDIDVTSAEATVVDEKAAPVADNLIQLCGLNLCLNGKTGADGHVVVPAGGKKLTSPAFKYGDAILYGKFAVPIKDAVTTLGTVVTVKLPASGEALEAGKASISGGVTLNIPAGAGVEVDELTYDTPDKQVFKAAQVPIANGVPWLDPALKLDAVWAVAPIDTIFCPAVGVTVDNTPNYAPGAMVEFYIHGVGVEEYYVPYGGWTKISDGVVSPDGKTITTMPDGGLPILTDFGVRLKM